MGKFIGLWFERVHTFDAAMARNDPYRPLVDHAGQPTLVETALVPMGLQIDQCLADVPRYDKV